MNKGFSLVELIVVIAIMAILVGVAVPVYTQYISSANTNVDKQTVGEVEHAIEVLLIDPEVTNPTITSGDITLTLSGETFAWASGVTDTNSEFLNALKAIVPDVELKSGKIITFTLNTTTLTVQSDVETQLGE